ncbi:MAG: signal recognition particle-docking protein FtsY [Deltaproteobacteria bacterium]|nr:MAG: signal recognition particle-docking protein FtsY [Deltaproteobacteria bacterium]
MRILGGFFKRLQKQEPEEGWRKSLKEGLAKTRRALVEGVDDLIKRRKEIDQGVREELEELLIAADIGVKTSGRLLETAQEMVSKQESAGLGLLKEYLKEAIKEVLVGKGKGLEIGVEKPLVIMMVGVNGVGKTTTIGKIASQFSAKGLKVMLVAADTFRAAAIDQLRVWAERAGAEFISQQPGSDPAAVVFDALEAARARGMDMVVVDTAGRLHTKTNLMDELKKIKRVMGKKLPGAPQEILLVLDATTGQNAVPQAKLFDETLGITGIILTKLDGTAKGGVIVAIANELTVPIRLIGIGERIEDLREFDPEQFVEALF